MLIRDVLDRKVACVGEHVSMRFAAELLSLSKASDLVVVDEEHNFVGILSEGDVLRALMPDTEEVIRAKGSLMDVAALFVESARSLAEQPIKPLIITNPITLHPDDDLIKAASVMVSKDIRRLPVVEFGKFVGTVSRADICWILVVTTRKLL